MVQSTQLNFNDIKYYTKQNFSKIKFQNKNILLNNFKTKTFYFISEKLWTKTHFRGGFATRAAFSIENLQLYILF